MDDDTLDFANEVARSVERRGINRQDTELIAAAALMLHLVNYIREGDGLKFIDPEARRAEHVNP